MDIKIRQRNISYLTYLDDTEFNEGAGPLQDLLEDIFDRLDKIEQLFIGDSNSLLEKED